MVVLAQMAALAETPSVALEVPRRELKISGTWCLGVVVAAVALTILRLMVVEGQAEG